MDLSSHHLLLPSARNGGLAMGAAVTDGLRPQDPRPRTFAQPGLQSSARNGQAMEAADKLDAGEVGPYEEYLRKAPSVADSPASSGSTSSRSGLQSSSRNAQPADLSITNSTGGVQLADSFRTKDPSPRPVTDADIQSSSAAAPFHSKDRFTLVAARKQHTAADASSYRAPVAPIVDSEGFKLVRSRKYGMVRGRFPDPELPPPADVTCEVEVPWGVCFGNCLRKIRKRYQARKAGWAMTSDGPGYFTYGSYGPDGHEYYSLCSHM